MHCFESSFWLVGSFYRKAESGRWGVGGSSSVGKSACHLYTRKTHLRISLGFPSSDGIPNDYGDTDLFFATLSWPVCRARKLDWTNILQKNTYGHLFRTGKMF